MPPKAAGGARLPVICAGYAMDDVLYVKSDGGGIYTVYVDDR